MAISALSISRQGHSPSAAIALRFYKAAVSSLRVELGRDDLRQNECVPWTTFFLGMFELIYDNSGSGWLKHFLHGTAQLLQHRGPSNHLTGAGRRFFLTVRIFEISRALIYSTETFLARPAWQAVMRKIWGGPWAKEWHPKEDLYDLMVDCSTLGVSTLQLVLSPASATYHEGDLRAHAARGLGLQFSLQNWKTSALAWSQANNTNSVDLQLHLALTYHHALTIYLSGIFDYHPSHFNNIPSPVLSTPEIRSHVSSILENVETSLQTTYLAGVLFLFPLRVAGARVRNIEQAERILRLLRDIERKGFVVAQAFSGELVQLWGEKGIVH